jgi:hypothetical protein
MKLQLIFFSLITLLNSFTLINAQGGVGLASLYLNPSPQLNGLGWIGVSYPNDGPLGFYYNPAMLGYSSQHNNISAEFYPGASDWASISELEYSNLGFNLGYNFKNELNGLNLSLGVGYIYSKFSFGTFRTYEPTGVAESFDSYDAYGIGLSLDYIISISMGITFKSIRSAIIGDAQYTTNANATDYGILFGVPVIKLIDDNFSFQLSEKSKLKPILNYNLGYSKLNIGDEFYYIDQNQKDPLPLTARLGHTLSFGLDYETDKIFINLIKYDLILEADDILIQRDSTGFSYQSLLGDIDFWKNLIQLKGDENVVVHKGHAISLIETVTILIGNLRGRGYNYIPKTNGLLFSSKGLLKWLNSELETDFLKFVSKHLELRYTSSNIFSGREIETNMSSISLHFMNYAFN